MIAGRIVSRLAHGRVRGGLMGNPADSRLNALWITAMLALTACQAPPPSPVSSSPPVAHTASQGQPPSHTAAAPAPSPTARREIHIAAWETSHPFSLAALVEWRLRQPLVASNRRRIDVAAAHALADERGALYRWSGAERSRRGSVRLVRRVVSQDGRVCARLHHEHQMGRRAILGSVRICRKRGDAAAPWSVDDVRWIRVGNDLAQQGTVSGAGTPPV